MPTCQMRFEIFEIMVFEPQQSGTFAEHQQVNERVMDSNELEKELSLRSFIGIILSIGIRPCSGAVIVLLLAFSLGHVVAGLFAVLAMSFGTAVAIALLATFSVYFRRTAQLIVQSKHNTRHLVGVIPTIIGILGGGLIFIFGLSFFISALTAPAHPFR